MKMTKKEAFISSNTAYPVITLKKYASASTPVSEVGGATVFPSLGGALLLLGHPGLLFVCLGVAQVISWVLFLLRRANELLSGDNGF
jgi:hypothetical protein